MPQIRMLLAAGADPNLLDRKASTLLHDCANEPAEDTIIGIIDLLVAHGANLEIYDNDSDTPLGVAAIHGYLRSARALLGHGADILAPLSNQGSRKPARILESVALIHWEPEKATSAFTILVEQLVVERGKLKAHVDGTSALAKEEAAKAKSNLVAASLELGHETSVNSLEAARGFARAIAAARALPAPHIGSVRASVITRGIQIATMPPPPRRKRRAGPRSAAQRKRAAEHALQKKKRLVSGPAAAAADGYGEACLARGAALAPRAALATSIGSAPISKKIMLESGRHVLRRRWVPRKEPQAPLDVAAMDTAYFCSDPWTHPRPETAEETAFINSVLFIDAVPPRARSAEAAVAVAAEVNEIWARKTVESAPTENVRLPAIMAAAEARGDFADAWVNLALAAAKYSEKQQASIVRAPAVQAQIDVCKKRVSDLDKHIKTAQVCLDVGPEARALATEYAAIVKRLVIV